MISIIITAFKEKKTITKAISSIAEQKIPKTEIIVVAPDNETLDEAKKLKRRYNNLKILKDDGKGKSAALNLAVSKSKGEILVLTDGDVYVSENSLFPLLSKLRDKKIGAVTGRPVSINNKRNMFGFWAHILTEIAHKRRTKALKNSKRFFCSGYLFTIKRNLFPILNEELLSEDGYISHHVYSKGFKINYSPESLVFVKYPSNFKDWINQKKRSAGGYNQIKSLSGIEIRSFRKESLGGLELLKEASNIKELFYVFTLYFARIYLWTMIYLDINVKKKNRDSLWKRVDSTK